MTELNLKNFPEDLHRELKLRAVQEGKTMRALVIEALLAAYPSKPAVKPTPRKLSK
jgi:plasmid stability protein